MNVGDVVVDKKNKSWVIYDFTSIKGIDLLCVTDIETQSCNEVLCRDEITLLIPKQDNVEYLFLARREKNLKGLEEFFK